MRAKPRERFLCLYTEIVSVFGRRVSVDRILAVECYRINLENQSIFIYICTPLSSENTDPIVCCKRKAYTLDLSYIAEMCISRSPFAFPIFEIKFWITRAAFAINRFFLFRRLSMKKRVSSRDSPGHIEASRFRGKREGGDELGHRATNCKPH